MKVVLVACLLLSVALAHDKSKSDSDVEEEKQPSCMYTVNEYSYDFSRAQGQVYTYTSQGDNGKNITWSWSLCGPMNDSACGPNSALCIVDDTTPTTTFTSYGNTSIALAGDDDSLTLSFAGEQECTPGEKKTASIKLNCTKKKKKEGMVQAAERDACTASLTISSRMGCAMDDDEEGHKSVLIPLVITLPLVLCCVVGAVTCICCRRRMLRKKAGFTKLQEECNSIQMQPPVMAQPQPVVQQFTPQPLQQPIRLMMPMQAQQPTFPSYFPMYPMVQMPGQFPPTAPVPAPSAAVVPPAPREVQLDTDAKMARDLQAQFDKESQV